MLSSMGLLTRGERVVLETLRRRQYVPRPFATLVSPANTADDGTLPTIVHSSLSQGCLDYRRTWAWQQLLLHRRLAIRRTSREDSQAADVTEDDRDVVLILEHSPVYTLGRGADENHLRFVRDKAHVLSRERLSRSSRGVGSSRLSFDSKTALDGQIDDHVRQCQEAGESLCQTTSPVVAPNGAPVYRVDRGGEVTFHGPGQLVVYPLFDLKRHPYQADLHWFLRKIEDVIINTLGAYEIVGVRDDANTGVWVGDDKIAAVGLSASRWITTHGFALNVNPDLSYFDTSVILPCGVPGKGVTSISKVLTERGGDAPSLPDVSAVVISELENVFQIPIERGEAVS